MNGFYLSALQNESSFVTTMARRDVGDQVAMSDAKTIGARVSSLTADDVPLPAKVIFRGIGQVFFQENALTGALFALGLAVNSPWAAVGAIVGSAVGAGTARGLRFDHSEIAAGLYGFNSALVGIATFFFFGVTPASFVLMLVGTAVAAPVTWLMRRYIPFPTYTTPFIVVTWVLYFLGPVLGASLVSPGGGPFSASFIEAVAHGIGQVMFQASVWTALLFLIGIALNDREHAAWVVVASLVGMLVGVYHHDSSEEVAALGLYGYNATLAAIALFLNRRSLIAPMLGILISVPLTENFPRLGLPTLTAPFVLATWLVLILVWLDGKLFSQQGTGAK
jgi:urea transporter